MEAYKFQEEVIDRLARIETKQDATSVRVNTLEIEVSQLRLSAAQSRGAVKVLATGIGLVGGAIGGAIEYFFRR